MNYLINKMLRDFEAGLKGRDIQYFFFGKPRSLSKEVLDKGVLFVHPLNTDVSPVTTGITDEETKSVRIVLVKNVQDEFIKNSQRETGANYITRVMEGKDDSNNLLTNTVRYIVRSNYRQWGISQRGFTIEYDTNEVENVAEGAVSAGINLIVIDHYTQPIN